MAAPPILDQSSNRIGHFSGPSSFLNSSTTCGRARRKVKLRFWLNKRRAS
jgi:hypothetical protein